MPIYIEARDVGGLFGFAGGHLYLVYVPVGQEDNYSAWNTIGAFPEVPGNVGPWGLLQGSAINIDLYDSPDAYVAGETPEDRGRVLLYQGANEAGLWADFVDWARELDGQYTYKGYGAASSVWAPGSTPTASSARSFIMKDLISPTLNLTRQISLSTSTLRRSTFLGRRATMSS